MNEKIKEVIDRQKDSHENKMGGVSYDIKDPITKLKIAASSCFFGEPQYYHSDPDDPRPKRQMEIPWARSDAAKGEAHLVDVLHPIGGERWQGKTPAQIIEDAIDEALAHDPEATLKEAVRLRTQALMRTTPIVILVRAANHPNIKGTGLVRKYARHIVDEIPNSLSYHLSAFANVRTGGKRPIPMSLLRSYDDAFHRFSKTQIAKYRMEGREVSLIDAVNLTYGLKRSWSGHGGELTNPRIPDSIKSLIDGNLKVSGKTWEAVVSAEGSSKESWEKSIDKMGHMALLRNIRNLLNNDVDPDKFLPKLIETAEDGKQMPFRYLSARNEVKKVTNSEKVLNAIEKCLDLSIGNLPKFEGRTMILTDNSGSAQNAYTSSMGTMPIAKIGNLMGVMTGMASEEGVVGVFGDRLKTIPINKKAGVLKQTEDICKIGAGIGPSTEHGIWLFWDGAIRNEEHWDTVFIYSDMQAGHGGLYGLDARDYDEYRWLGSNHIDVPLLIDMYRRRVNPDVDVFLVQIAGKEDAVVPEWYHKTYILGGWSAEVIRFAREMKDLV